MVKRQIYNLEYGEWLDIDDAGFIIGTNTLGYREINVTEDE